MKFLILAVLTVSASAANWGYSKNYGGYPSYSYSSSYPSSSYGLGYGSSIYGTGYGSYGSGYGSYGSGYGSYGSGYGSGLGYGLGSGGYYSGGYSYKPSVYKTARYSYSKYPYEAGEATYGSAVRGFTSTAGPGKISFTKDFSGAAGQSGYGTAAHGATGYEGVKSSTYKPSGSHGSWTQRFSNQGAAHDGIIGGGAPGKISFTRKVSQVSGQTDHGSLGVVGTSGLKTGHLSSIKRTDHPSQGFGTIQGTGVHSVKTTTDQGHSPFIQDVSRVTDQTGITIVEPEVDTFDKVVAAPVKPVYGPAHGFGSAHRGGSHTLGTTGGHQQVVVHDTSRLSGHGQSAIKPAIHRQFSRYTQRADAAHRGGYHGVSSLGGPRISFILGHAGQRQGDNRLTSFDRPSVPAVVSRKPYDQSHVTRTLPKTTHGFTTSAIPSRIEFTQDVSRITGQHVSDVKPVTFQRTSAPAFPASAGFQEQRNKGFATSSVVQKPAQVLTAVRQDFTVQKQPVSGQVVYTEEKYYTEGHSPVDRSSVGHGVGDVSSFNSGAGFAEYKHLDDLKEVAVTDGVQHSLTEIGQSNLGAAVSGYQLSPGVDKSAYVAVPAAGYENEKSSIFFHSSGVAPAGGIADDKGSAFQYSSGVSGSGLISHGAAGRTQGYTTVTEPFKSYYSSWYPGYSHVSGKSPRYEFSPDRNLLYSYNSPYLVSPFSYTYTSSGSKQYPQKQIA